jgi:ferredoxin-NADP reductase
MPLVKITSTKKITPDVIVITTEKPSEYSFVPGQATEIAINKAGWQDEKRPFTFTSLPDNDFLEFTIKTYPSHKGVTIELLQAAHNDELMLGDVFGEIAYKGEGTFIAGGAGITPFISIFRHLRAKNEIGSNKLLFANKTKADIILENEFQELLGSNFINILSDEKRDGYAHGYINEDFLKANLNLNGKPVYVCGPPAMMDAVEGQLRNLQVNESLIIKEAF